MALSDDVADLHMHTTASDGTCSVADRIEQATARGLGAIAITDHDTIANDLDGRSTRVNGIELITGVEVRADIDGTKVELLGYYIDPDDPTLTTVLEQVRTYRRDRNREIVEVLRSVTDFDREYERLRSDAEGILGRPHIADALVEMGIVESVGKAFKTYLGADGAAYVPMDRIAADEVIAAIKGAGGVVSLAHPGRIRTDDPVAIVERLHADDLDAIEVPYPYAEAPAEGYAEVTVADAAEFADEFNLLHTGGSDCHGPDSGKFRIGSVRVSSVHLDALRTRAGERR
ncbi:MAG: PHP domain-containing protein [Halorientalis sp.]